MDSEIQLISDHQGVAVVGEEKAVEKFLRDEGLWKASRSLDLRRLRSVLGLGSDLAKAASEFQRVQDAGSS